MGLAYTDVKKGKPTGRTGTQTVGSGEAGGFQAANDWMSQERTEVFGAEKKTQVKLDPLQVCLYPTFLSLPEEALQEDLRENLQTLVSETLSNDYGENFVYFAFTDAKIDWYSGEESEPICGSLQHRLPGVDTPAATPRDAYLLQSSTPCTCALYSGATVMFKTGENRASDAGNAPSGATSETLEPKIASALTDGLVPLLHEDEPSGEDARRRPFYTELKGASVSWSAAQRQQGGKLVYADAKEPPAEGTEQLAPSESDPNPATILDEGVEDSTTIEVIGVNALEAGAMQEQPKANAFSTTRGKILASVLGALVFVSLAALFVRLCYKKNQRRKEQVRTGKTSDQNTVITESPDAVDVEIAGAVRSRRKGSIGSASSADSDDLSENAQCKTPGKIVDTISVGSEWTLTTGVTDGVASALGLQSTGSKTLAEMMAAKETFDRDRQITLQKDMLQSEWSGAVNPPSGLALSRVGSRPIGGSGSNKKLQSKTTRHEEPNGLQFEMAGG